MKFSPLKSILYYIVFLLVIFLYFWITGKSNEATLKEDIDSFITCLAVFAIIVFSASIYINLENKN
ncbi:MAG: hypothetical protein CMP76_16950 [Flavobacterium sp.]|nr:hypothetical protein [Flavobacterium sp.]|tara:strand:- start:2470 stop:2667 length:198 start_codon:yes stop_codon:yes gene_type:complete